MDSTDGTVPNSHYKSSFLGRRITQRHALPEWLTKCLSAQNPLTAVEWNLASNYTNLRCRLLHSCINIHSSTCTLQLSQPHTHTHTHTHTHSDTDIHNHQYTHTHTHTHTHSDKHQCTHTHSDTHQHTHTHTPINPSILSLQVLDKVSNTLQVWPQNKVTCLLP